MKFAFRQTIQAAGARFRPFALVLVPLLICARTSASWAQEKIITLKNGLEYQGSYATIPEYSEVLNNATPPGGGLYPIAMVDDGLRRSFFHYKQIAQEPVFVERPFQRISVWQELGGGQSVTWRDGNLVRAEPFNEMGHRTITTNGTAGGGTFVQAITEVTPLYCSVAPLHDKGWDMRVATTTIPSDVLIKLLRRQISDSNNVNKRLEIVDLLLQAERYQDANAELKSVQQDFPDLTQEIAQKRQILSQQFARQVLGEIRTRFENGQTELALAMAEKIKGPDVSAEILAEILALERGLGQSQTEIESAKSTLRQQLELLIQETKLAGDALATVNLTSDEITNELNSANLPRLATFVRLAPDPAQSASQKVAYAISGWVIGSAAAVDNLAVAIALVDARRLVIEYLTTSDPERRQSILSELTAIEASDPQYLSKIVENITPPMAPSAEVDLRKPIELSVEIPSPAVDGKPRQVKYLAQLPAQYNPYRRYPCIVALHAEGQSLESQLQWWAGTYNAELKMAMGQASRFGYIVIAPEWNQAMGRDYSFSAIEQAAVMKTLREAMRRFAIDSDRVYLTGHFAGGDAAWDIGISFPDVWAGVVPISAAAGENGKYASSCHEAIANHNLGFRFVSGQLDLGRIVDNKIVWNKWMQSPDFDVTVVEYRGRLAETFAEELPNIFRWMARHKRILATEQFSGRTLRPWVRQFWWVEVERLAAENVVLPHEWPPREKLLAQQIEGKFQREKNKLIVSVPKSSVTTVWILPELVDFGKIVEVTARGIDFRGMLKPSRNVLLEDVRRRADRQHPYWAKLVCEKATWRAE